MMKITRLALVGLLVAFVAAQFFRSPRNAGTAEGPSSVGAVHPVPAGVRQILARACYDCHSNATRYPWYAAVQPVGWGLNHHVTEGRRELNFSEFAAYDARRAVRKLRHVADEVSERKMPLKSYLLLHREARLTAADIALVSRWAEELADRLESR
ncbi:MAG: heme-binding domain-containing protein [Opitutae bacterium]|nr:heme-binding domain-containing protein [Opitutae bacterium]